MVGFLIIPPATAKLITDKLEKMLVAAIEEEDYEKASELRDEIKKRNEN